MHVFFKTIRDLITTFIKRGCPQKAAGKLYILNRQSFARIRSMKSGSVEDDTCEDSRALKFNAKLA